MISSRRFLLVALGLSTFAPIHLFGQQPQPARRIAILLTGADTSNRRATFVQAMQKRGYVEGRDYVIEIRFGANDYARLPALAAELLKSRPDVILAAASPAIRAASAATKTIPIIAVGTGDPVGAGFVKSLARPGGNVTGLTNSNVDVDAKLFDLLRRIAPRISRVGLLENPGSSSQPAHHTNLEAAAKVLGLSVVQALAGTPKQLEAAFELMEREKVDALIMAADVFLIGQSSQVASFAMRRRIPTITQNENALDGGILMTYGRSNAETWRGAATFVERIFKGAKAGDLPMEQPTALELSINLRTAKAIGVTIAPELLVAAQRVIE